MATIRIRRKPGSTLTWIANAAFRMRFPIDQDVFEVPSNHYAYLKAHFDIVETTDVTGTSGKKPCWQKTDIVTPPPAGLDFSYSSGSGSVSTVDTTKTAKPNRIKPIEEFKNITDKQLLGMDDSDDDNTLER